MWRHTLIVSLCALLVVGSLTWFTNKYFGIEAHALVMRLWPPPTRAQIERRNLRKIAGWFSLDCGHVPHRGEADRAIVCAQGALKTGRPFYVSFDIIGLDSQATLGLAANSKGQVYFVSTNDLGRGFGGYLGPGGPWRDVDITRCAEGTVDEVSVPPANRYLRCLPYQTE
jgi:hypothetical protein